MIVAKSVWWLQIGANDLALTQCSEEAVIVGILRLADEIKVQHPESVVVVQSILPRSSSADGHVRAISNSTRASKTLFHHSTREYFKSDEYPLWPSIQLINAEVAKFCAKHEHLVRRHRPCPHYYCGWRVPMSFGVLPFPISPNILFRTTGLF